MVLFFFNISFKYFFFIIIFNFYYILRFFVSCSLSLSFLLGKNNHPQPTASTTNRHNLWP